MVSASHALSQEADGTNCPSGVSGLCTPGVFESATETVTEVVQSDATGTTTTTTTTTNTTTTFEYFRLLTTCYLLLTPYYA